MKHKFIRKSKAFRRELRWAQARYQLIDYWNMVKFGIMLGEKYRKLLIIILQNGKID